MECEVNEYEISCTVCNKFKVPTDVYAIVKKIAEILGTKEEIEYVGDGKYLIDEIEIRCEWIEFSWSDYCIHCFVV
jgi:hypothetical protein